MSREQQACIFGETLFDCFPDGEVPGGAPFNVAWHLQGLECPPLLVSRVGDDTRGLRLQGLMEGWGLDTGYLQVDTHHPTGIVRVEMRHGEPAYRIEDQQAYDHLTPPVHLPSDLGILYHGTLALRHQDSRDALEHIHHTHGCPVFIDLNLRSPWWRPGDIPPLLHRASHVKLNEAELAQLAGEGGDQDIRARGLLRAYGLDTLCVTRGAAGAVVYCRDGARYETCPAAAVPVVDTVGAGDAFAAVLLLGLLRDWPLPLTLARAQELATAMVGRRGATVNDPAFYHNFLLSWSTP